MGRTYVINTNFPYTCSRQRVQVIPLLGNKYKSFWFLIARLARAGLVFQS